MDARCALCALLDEKTHCKRCKIYRMTKVHEPKQIMCSDEELVEYIENHDDVSELYGVGDYKTINLYTGEEVKLVILGLDQDALVDGGTAKVTFGVFGMSAAYQMNDTADSLGGWRRGQMRQRMKWFCKLLPPAYRDHVKWVNKISYKPFDSSKNMPTAEFITKDALFLFSASEIIGENQSIRDEGEQYDYFKNIPSSLLKGQWVRSCPDEGASRFCYIEGGACYARMANAYLPVVFGFCI